MGALDELTVECRFYAAMHELARLAWQHNMTVDALLTLTELLIPDPDDEAECPRDGKPAI